MWIFVFDTHSGRFELADFIVFPDCPALRMQGSEIAGFLIREFASSFVSIGLKSTYGDNSSRGYRQISRWHTGICVIFPFAFATIKSYLFIKVLFKIGSRKEG
jgi:hypothetical protein